jgi:hypothetical protein
MMLQRQDGEPWGMAEVPIGTFHQRLPKSLRPHVNLCRAFVLRAGAALRHPERHVNSIQRLMAYQNAGTMHVASSGSDHFDFQPFSIAAPHERTGQLSKHWDVVPPNTWHYPAAAPGADWQTITFHSISAADIREVDALHYRLS